MIPSPDLWVTRIPLSHGTALDQINRIQTRQRLNPVVNTGVPGFIPQAR